jgi:2',3'-cyclic-nucleotide 2'-phosphodiesterase (5'-nucleotidase family)
VLNGYARTGRFLPSSLTWLLGLLLALSLAVLSACEGCRPRPSGASDARNARDTEVAPTARLFLVSDLAGALEPCGCVKDQLGGMDHFGAVVAGRSSEVAPKLRPKGFATVSAGPLFFMDMELSADRKGQEISKAETIAASLRGLGFAAFAPARNDWAGGADVLGKLRERSGAAMLGANVTLAPSGGVSLGTSVVKDVGGLKIGFVGVAAPDKAKSALPGAASSEAIPALRPAIDAAKKDGAQAIVALAAVGRGEAKRIADAFPELLAVVVGSNGGNGESNTKAPPAERIGNVLVVETGNHLQTVAVLDLYVDAGKPGDANATLTFADGTGIDGVRKREELTTRIADLRTKIAVWEGDGKVAKADIDARKKDVAALEAERDAQEKSAPVPAAGNFFRYAMREVRSDMGADDATKAAMNAFYKKVNDANRLAFADRLPKKPAVSEASYAGIDACSSCHEDARKVWDKTRHAHAYETLSVQFKEFNLDCVSCHVTGYDRPGGSTVTHVENLKDVQCEVCHGPGSLHAKEPEKNKIPIAKPTGDSCTACHHPPHVHTFDAAAKMPEILGPGHGRPKT